MDQTPSKRDDALYVGTVIYGKHAPEIYDKLESEAELLSRKAKSKSKAKHGYSHPFLITTP